MTVARRSGERGEGAESSWQCIGGSGTVQKPNPVLWDSYKDSEMTGRV